MIEGCIVAKLVQGYLTDEGFHKTCSAFQEECALFRDGNNELDQVFLTADLKTILEDYSQLKETGRDNGIPTSTAVLKSLWKDLDTVIGQLKYATIPSIGPKVNTMGSQATRTRRLNSGRSRRNMLQKNQEISTGTASNPSTIQRSSTPNLPENKTAEKLPLPRLSTAGPSQTSSSSDHTRVTNNPSSCADQRAQDVVQLTASKNSNTSQMLNLAQPTGAPVPVSVSSVSCTSQVTGIHPVPNSFGPAAAPVVGNSCDSDSNNKPSSSNDDATTDSMFDLSDDGAFCNDDFSNSGVEHCGTKTTPIIIVDNERSKEQQVTTNEEHSLSSSHPSQTELLRSPKRKCVQPKKRVPPGCQSTSTVAESPVKLVPQSANKEVELDIVNAPDMLTPQSFLGTLLNTPLLQEKLAENINKVVSSSRVVPAAGDELSSDSTHCVTSTEASSDDVFMTSSQVEGAGGDIPVKEIMDLMQADPAFDVLFSFFGLDALEALPSTTHSSTDLPGEPADSNLNNKTTSLPGSELQIQDTLGALSSLPTETMSDLGSGVTSLSGLNLELDTLGSMPENTTLQASAHQLDNPSSSSASDLHMSAASIVTDALLLLAGSPQKKSPSRASPQLNYSTKVPVSEQSNPDTPPRELHSAHGSLVNDKQPCRQSIVNQPALITSTLPYVRALNFAIGNGPAPSKRGRKKGSKNKNNKKLSQMITEQKEKTANNKVASSGRTQVISKEASQLTVTSSSQATSCSTIIPRTGSSQVPHNSGSPFNRIILPRGSTANVMMSGAPPSPLPYSFSNCVPGSAPLPDNVVGCSLSPVSHADAVTHPMALPGNHIAVGSSAALTPLTFNIPTCPNPSPVNLTSSCSFQTPTVFSPSSFPSCSSPANLTTFHPPQTPSVGCPVNSTTHPTPSSTGQGTASSSHASSSASHSLSNVSLISRTMSAQHVVNTVTTLSSAGLPETVLPGHFTHLRLLPTTTSTGNSVSIQGDQGNQAVASSSGLSAPAEPLSRQASNFLQTLALKHVSAQKNSSASQSVAQGSQTGELAMEGSQNNRPISTVNSAMSQPSNEKSASLVNIDVSENNTVATTSEKQLAHSSSCANSVEQESRLAGKSLQNSQESENGSTSSLEILDRECSELTNENSTSVSNSQTNSGGEMQRSTNLQRKRQRDASQPLKKKKSKSSRLSKRSKTGEEGINFPSDLNVEEFLAKLQYEDK